MKKTHPIRRLLLLLLAALVAGLAAMPMLSSLETEEQDAASILSAGAERRTVSRFLSYGAPLETQQPEAVTVPSGVGVTEYLVSGGDTVRAGDPIARVDRVSVMTAVQQVQQSLETIAGEMKEVRAQITPGIITVDESGSVCVWTAGRSRKPSRGTISNLPPCRSSTGSMNSCWICSCCARMTR